MEHEIQETCYVESPEQATALLNPIRAEILSKLTEPASATEVARMINETPQRVNYHLKALEKVGLARRIGTRQVRNLVEVLYQSIARTFVISELLGWHPETVQRIKDQSSLSHLISTSDRIKRDALMLMDHSEQSEQIPSATLTMKVQLESEERRKQFVQDYVQAVQALVANYQSSNADDDTYNVILAIYPECGQGGDSK
ncbi:ArsR family transcriptional regulator [Tumebacillus algifaecis]|uniref:ArsR family transcriptional regulator n=1 Tax=Tumebacillus algifaecis TaxID=1214604 RepID=A0A223D125_9BACL|nr:helix-turn-helix domain-containing protein [Tumebacillus algifaecis]ASS75310.1 ArsR family transcriptional regulator [Tumebacillus algifaecis]